MEPTGRRESAARSRNPGTWIQISNSAVCRYSFAISRLIPPEVCWDFPHAPRSEGAGMPGADAPAAKSVHVVATVTPETPGIPAQWFTAYFALTPAIGLFCHRHLRDLPQA